MLEFISILLVALAVAALVRMVWIEAKEKQMPASVAPAASYQMNFAATTAEPAAEPAMASESESLEPEVSSTALSNANFIAVDFETATLKRSACQVGIVVVKAAASSRRSIGLSNRRQTAIRRVAWLCMEYPRR